jgi:CubicO group peptidase (beta-lactamase class C family)
VGIVRDGSLGWAAGVGFADLVTGARPNERTLYRIASITKTFTATAVLQLRDAGRLRLDDALTKYLPEFAVVANPFGPIEDVTIRRLLLHRSGLQSEQPVVDPRKATFLRADEVLGMLDRVRVAVPPESAFKYSNLGYEFLGEAVRRLSGLPLTEYVADRITGPLGMASTMHEARGQLAARCAVGYDARHFDDRVAVAREIDSLSVEGDAGLWSSVEDLALWVSQQFRLGTDSVPQGGQVLHGSTLREMHRAVALNDTAWIEAQGLGWYTTREDGVSWVGHSGTMYGFTTNISFEPEERLGAIVLLNGIGPADKLARNLAAEVLPIHRDAADAKQAAAAPPDPAPPAWQELLGAYQEVEFAWDVRIECRGADLVCATSETLETPCVLEPTPDPLAFTVRGGRQSGETALFLRGTDGGVDGLNLGGIPMVRLVPATG